MSDATSDASADAPVVDPPPPACAEPIGCPPLAERSPEPAADPQVELLRLAAELTRFLKEHEERTRQDREEDV